MNFLINYKILDNSIERIFWFFVIILIALIFKRYLSKLLSNLFFELMQRFTNEKYHDEFKQRILPPLDLFIVLVIVQIALQALTYPSQWKIMVMGHSLETILAKAMQSLLLLSFSWVLLRVVDFISQILKKRAARTESKADDQLVHFGKDALKILIVVSAVFFFLGSILGFNITSLLAGLGIGGLAIAFAAQESIKDLFGSFTIFWDKPFMVGDLVKIGDITGTVEKIGIRSTRIRTSQKTLVTMPNKKMVDSNVDNLQLRTFRQVDITIGLPFETNPEVMKKIISDLRDIFNNKKEFPEENFVLFDSFGESSFNIRILYFIPFNEWLEFLKKKEEINFRIVEVVTGNGARFAYPVRDIRMDAGIFEKK